MPPAPLATFFAPPAREEPAVFLDDMGIRSVTAPAVQVGGANAHTAEKTRAAAASETLGSYGSGEIGAAKEGEEG